MNNIKKKLLFLGMFVITITSFSQNYTKEINLEDDFSYYRISENSKHFKLNHKKSKDTWSFFDKIKYKN